MILPLLIGVFVAAVFVLVYALLASDEEWETVTSRLKRRTL